MTMTADVVLRDGSTLHVRSVRDADLAGLAGLRADLAGQGQTFRVFDAPDDPDHWVRQFTAVGPGQGAVIVGEVGGRLNAVAGFRRRADRDGHAEVVLAVAPALQGRGIGTRLLEMLADVARAMGVTSFDAWVARDDRPILDVFMSSGFDVDREPEGGVLHLVLRLSQTPRFLERSAERAQEAAAATMRSFFEPCAVAVIGANREPGRIGSEILQNLLTAGFTGPVYPVHPDAGKIGGLTAYARVGDIPGPVDLAVVVVPAKHVAGVVDDCLAKGVKALVVISAGFAETGPAGAELEAVLVEKVRAAGVRLVGPNCMGLINTDPAVRLNATFSPVYPPAGRVAMSTQSGALGLAILDYARRLDLGISTFVSVGNKADVSSNDLIQYWADDDATRVILLYLESFGNPRKFSQIARRVARKKPIIAVKSGRSAAGARAASSHTGALASSDVIVDALFRQAGVIRTNTLEELFDVASLVAHQPVPRGRRVAIITNAGGPGILAADACEAQGLLLPRLADRTVATLRSFLPAAAAIGNPVDMIASASAEHYGRTLSAVLADEGVDSALVIFIPPLVTRTDDVARAVKAAAAPHPDKPVLGIVMSSQFTPGAFAPIPCYAFPEAATAALARAAVYGEWLAVPPAEAAVTPDLDAGALRAIIDAALARGGGWLTPAEAQALVAAAGIPAAVSRVAESEADAIRAAEAAGYPVVLKAVGPAIVHKTEIDGVRLGLADAAAVRAVWREFSTRLAGTMTGVLVQEMVKGGVEMLAGVTEDPVFGPVVACAMGGVLAELLSDAACRLCPLTERDAASMIDSLRGVTLLRGYRGAPAADEAALRSALLRLSTLAETCPEIREMDINPLVVLPRGVKAVDIRVRIERPRPPVRTRRVVY
jgi:acetyl coenzyme A synthetase (ADP forming)-like protein